MPREQERTWLDDIRLHVGSCDQLSGELRRLGVAFELTGNGTMAQVLESMSRQLDTTADGIRSAVNRHVNGTVSKWQVPP